MICCLGAFNKSVFDGNTILFKISEEEIKSKYVYIGRDMVCSFLIIENIYIYYSNMGNILTPQSVDVDEPNIFFTSHFKFIKKGKIDDNDLLKSLENSVTPYDYPVEKCGLYCFKNF